MKAIDFCYWLQGAFELSKKKKVSKSFWDKLVLSIEDVEVKESATGNSHESMTPDQFVFWLKGYVDFDGKRPNKKQWKIIGEHLSLVFTKVTPTGIGTRETREQILRKVLETGKSSAFQLPDSLIKGADEGLGHLAIRC